MSSLEPNLADNWEFTELWIDPTASPPYVLILLSNNGETKIYDPAEKYKAIFSSATYKEAKLWLLEDEYERFEQRFHAEKVA
ncbi:hypothetical protein PN462_00805 [Spirulina sp. CS-785/01]|uniref:hypothetical protein n=1 Tax=Spirulina sp. CS-785/01 TaxID=3021716 RepID=UPI00232D98DE|nr:hypothetical protein [Spirulina sp. CS-785/01]MDB9311621.1 hypothetical protein [Spirulina sp. CS-785/01]